MDLAKSIDRFRGPPIGLIVSWGAPHANAVVSPVTWWDYVKYEQDLWCAVMLVFLCIFATWISPGEDAVDPG
ncbi:hypothetical protein [Novipirellula artificiosorum]|nr:hypothetical protein [Novipirellula artificiosorum]